MFFSAARSSSWGWITFKNYAKAGESYIGRTIDTLEDLNSANTEYAEGTNLRIKAFTNESEQTEIVEETGITLNHSTATIKAGETLQLEATIEPSNATYKDVAYISSDTSLVTVDGNGLVTVNEDGKIGTATITARTVNSKKTATCQITVEPGPVTRISLIGSMNGYVGYDTGISATAYPATAKNRDILWSSSNAEIATIDSEGTIHCLKAGTVDIIATAADGSGVTATCKLIVTEALVENIILSSESVTLGIGYGYDMYPIINPWYATNKELEWTSSNPAVASVDEDGWVIANEIGKTTITARATDGSGVTATCEVTVSPAKVSYIIINTTYVVLDIGESTQVEATVYPEDAGNKALKWTSSDTEIATVDNYGKVTAVTPGSVMITATSTDGSNISATCTVEVLEPESYTITYVLNGGKNSSKNPGNYNVTTATIIFQNPSRKGYTFKGWYSDSKYTSKVTQIAKGSTGNKTLYAKWAANKYTIKFSGNGATSGKMASLTNRSYNKSYTLTTNKYKKTGYQFIGWNTKKNGKGTSYNNKAKVKNLTSTNGKTVTLYAQWKKVTYKITYNLNGGKNSTKNPKTYTVTSKTITLKAPTRKGYTFKGWYKDSKFKKKVTKITKGSTGNIKLYAKWVKKK